MEKVELLNKDGHYYISHHNTEFLVERKLDESDISYKATALAHFRIFVDEYNTRVKETRDAIKVLATDYLLE